MLFIGTFFILIAWCHLGPRARRRARPALPAPSRKNLCFPPETLLERALCARRVKTVVC
jgi:hypothetical protein